MGTFATRVHSARWRQVQVHPTAIVEQDVDIGPDSAVWDNAHIRTGARLGHNVSVGEKTCIAGGVTVGSWVKINAHVYICAGVTIEDMCMIAAGAVFTNDRYPRAMARDLTRLETSAPTEDTLSTRVCRGATVGANATIGPGLCIGAFGMVGMGTVVTRDVPAHGLVVGNPARLHAYVCVCGAPVASAAEVRDGVGERLCERCGRRYAWAGGAFVLRSALVLTPETAGTGLVEA